jgi:serine/threonine protein kinase
VRELAPGDEFAGHRVDAVIGVGGMGVVYRAVHLELERPVALKLIAHGRAADEAWRARFRRESRLAAALDHPAILAVYDSGEHEGLLYVAMRLVQGGDLGRRGERNPRPSNPVETLGVGDRGGRHRRMVHRRRRWGVGQGRDLRSGGAREMIAAVGTDAGQ